MFTSFCLRERVWNKGNFLIKIGATWAWVRILDILVLETPIAIQKKALGERSSIGTEHLYLSRQLKIYVIEKSLGVMFIIA